MVALEASKTWGGCSAHSPLFSGPACPPPSTPASPPKAGWLRPGFTKRSWPLELGEPLEVFSAVALRACSVLSLEPGDKSVIGPWHWRSLCPRMGTQGIPPTEICVHGPSRWVQPRPRSHSKRLVEPQLESSWEPGCPRLGDKAETGPEQWGAHQGLAAFPRVSRVGHSVAPCSGPWMRSNGETELRRPAQPPTWALGPRLQPGLSMAAPPPPPGCCLVRDPSLWLSPSCLIVSLRSSGLPACRDLSFPLPCEQAPGGRAS